MPIDPLTGLPAQKRVPFRVAPPESDPPQQTSTGNSPAIVAGTSILGGSPKPAGFNATGSWNYPDYAALLAKWLAPYQQMYDGDIAAAQAARDADVATARERYQEGDTSIVSRLKGVHEDNLTQIRNNLAARGLLGDGATIKSGEKDYQDARENLSYKRTRYDAENQLLDYLKGVEAAFAEAKRQGMLGLQEKQMDLAGTIGELYQPTYNAPGTSSYISAALAHSPWSQKAPGY